MCDHWDDCGDNSDEQGCGKDESSTIKLVCVIILQLTIFLKDQPKHQTGRGKKSFFYTSGLMQRLMVYSIQNIVIRINVISIYSLFSVPEL